MSKYFEAVSNPVPDDKAINSPPTSINLTALDISENEAIGTFIGIFSSNDPDSDGFTYTLVEGDSSADNANFLISGDSLKSNLSFNFENQASHSIRVQSDDGNGGTFQIVFTISITDKNEPLNSISLSSNRIPENEAIGTFIGIFSSNDPDSDGFTYTLVEGDSSADNANFLISGDSLKSNLSFNFENQASHFIRVQSDDGNGNTFEMVFTIIVTDVSTTTILSNRLIDENASIGMEIGILRSSEGNGNLVNDYTYTLVSGVGDSDNDSVSLVGDTLKSAAVFDYERKALYSIRIRSTSTIDGTSFESVLTIEVNNLAEWLLVTDNTEWGDRRAHTFQSFNNRLWVMGGLGNSNFNDVWSSADGATWTEVTNGAGWDARRGHRSVVFNNKIWVIGGITTSFSTFNDVWSSTDGITWIEATNGAGWDGRRSHTSVVFDNKLWVIGGNDNLNDFNDIWSSPDGITWTEATNEAEWDARSGYSFVVFENKIWTIGGSSNDGGLNDVWSSADGVTWTEELYGPSSWTEGARSVVFDNKIWRAGGFQDDSIWNYGL